MFLFVDSVGATRQHDAEGTEGSRTMQEPRKVNDFISTYM